MLDFKLNTGICSVTPAGLFDSIDATHPLGLMRFKPCTLPLCLLLLPGLSLAAEKTVYGLNEYANLSNLKLEVAAKLDTGAKTASLGEVLPGY